MDDEYSQTETLLLTVWTFFLIAVFFTGFIDEYRFPGERTEPLPGENLLWDVQRILFFGLMFVGFLIDVVRMREDRNKAFNFLLLSLLLGGFSSWISAVQFRFVSLIVNLIQPGRSSLPSDDSISGGFT